MAMDRSSRPMHRGRKKVCSFCVDGLILLSHTGKIIINNIGICC